MKPLYIDPSWTLEEQRTAVTSAFLCGFQAESAVFPVTTTDQSEAQSIDMTDPASVVHLDSGTDAPSDYEAASDHPGALYTMDFREQKGLENLLSGEPFLSDTNADFLPDQVNVRLILPDDADSDTVRAACEIAYRLGMETTGMEGEIAAGPDDTGSAIIFEPGDEPEMILEQTEPDVRVIIRGHGDSLLQFVSGICNSFPRVNTLMSLRDVLLNMCDDFCLQGSGGQAAQLCADLKENPQGSYEVFGSPYLKLPENLKGKASAHVCQQSRKIYEKTYSLPWEADRFQEHIEPLYQEIHAGDLVCIEGAISENKAVRDQLAKEIEQKLKERGIPDPEIQIICAYKQGYSWIDEVIIPEILALPEHTDRFRIYFKPFLPEGETEWVDENGATPTYHNLKADDPDKWYDLPIRYLQELYPIRDRLMQMLDLKEDQIKFLPYEGEENLTYLVQALQDEKILYESQYLAHASERQYLDAYPNLGKVHPPTGYIRMTVNGHLYFETEIKTDLEAVWEVYQKEVLPDCLAYALSKSQGVLDASMQPFFKQLDLDVWISEPDEKTGSREDLISSLDALHEDMYFTGSDYFKNYGVQNGGVMLDAPGLILPKIHQVEGAPVMKVTLYDCLAPAPEIRENGHVTHTVRLRDEVGAYLCAITPEQMTIQTKGVSENFLHAYVSLIEAGYSTAVDPWTGCRTLKFLSEQGRAYEAVLPAKKPQSSAKSIDEIDLHEHEVIGYDQYLEIIENLRCVPGIEVFRTATSLTGRILYGIYLKPHLKGYVSMTKRIALHPSEIINARHHANEVSSTNASFIMLKKLLTDPNYEDLADLLNLVVVPMENVDGAAIHYELQKEHPTWKLHVARFNSIGKEFYYEHFKDDTIHTEAMGLSRLVERFAPDIIVDNHGVPSHEWEQPFSGYTSPSYKGFWLPRSLLYGYFWYVTDPEYRSSYPLNKKMEDVIADRIMQIPEMKALNEEWMKQFETYAHAWLPKLFPAEYYKDMITYWIPFAADPNHRYPSIRFPWLVNIAYTSEVADETAQGDYLNLCARAHVAHDEATFDMLVHAKHVMDSHCTIDGNSISIRHIRRRPMIV